MAADSGQLRGRRAWVTGASKGIGRAIAVTFAAAGADVVVSARSEDLLDEVVKEITDAGGSAEAQVLDVTDTDAVAAVAESVGRVDVLVNNAGGNSFSRPLVGMRLSGWDKTQQLNVNSTVAMLQAVLPQMMAAGGGSVINVASVAALNGAPMMSHYAAAKASVISLTRSVALEVAHSGVRINALLPGWVETELTDFLRTSKEAESGVLSRVPMGRWAQVEDIAAGALFLASDASSFITGQELVIDGGMSVMP